jgi:hypothetical protein
MHIASGTHYASHVFQLVKTLPDRRVTSEELSTTVPEGLHKPAGAAVGNSGVNQTPRVRDALRFTHRLCAGPELRLVVVSGSRPVSFKMARTLDQQGDAENSLDGLQNLPGKITEVIQVLCADAVNDLPVHFLIGMYSRISEPHCFYP